MQTIKSPLRIVISVFVFLLLSCSSQAQKKYDVPNTKAEWSQDCEPFRIAGNLYYVGTYDLCCYLITTPKGHILINTGLAESTHMLRKHIEALGFKFSDIKILLTTQVHYDHVGAMAEIKKLTGARLMVNAPDAAVLADGGSSDYFMGGKGPLFEPVKADQLLHDGESVNWGGMHIQVLSHPGHTKGSTSFLFDVVDDNKSYRVLIANMPSVIVPDIKNVPGYPNIITDYAHTFEAMKKLKFDIWLAAHASQFDMHRKHHPGDSYHPEVFMDRAGYDAALDDLEKEYLKALGK